MKTTYKILFSIEILHDYYNHSQEFDDIVFLPDAETCKALRGYRCLFKIFKNRLFVLIETDETGKPYVSINSQLVFRIHLISKNSSFLNITSLKMFNNSNDIFYFSNVVGNKTDEICYLSKPLENYSTANDYEVGSVVQNGAAIFEAIQYNHPANAHNTGDNNFWRALQPERFPAYAETYRPEITKGTIDDIQKGTIVFDTASNNLYECKRLIFKGSRIELTNTSYWREVTTLQYVSAADITERSLYTVPPATLGILELFFDNTVSADMRLLTDGGIVKEQNFVIRFKNRISTWKYISAQNAVTAITDVNNVFSFTQDGNVFLSDAPVPLLAKPFHNFKLTAGSLEVEKLQCASAFIKPQTVSKSFVSEIYLNY